MLTPTRTSATVGDPGPALLVHHGQLLAVLDLRTPSDVDPPLVATPVSADIAGALDTLRSAGGVHVENISWWSTDGDLPYTVVVLTLDPAANRDAIDARGGGSVGAGRVVAVTVARAAALLAPYALRPRLLEPRDALRVLTIGPRQPVTSV